MGHGTDLLSSYVARSPSWCQHGELRRLPRIIRHAATPLHDGTAAAWSGCGPRSGRCDRRNDRPHRWLLAPAAQGLLGPIVHGDRQQITAQVRRAIDELGTTGLMIGAGCTVPSDIPIQNLVIARQAVVE